MPLIFAPEETILFIGDSITDGGRTREDPDHLGLTYPGIAAGMIQTTYPDLHLKFYNRGIGGDSVRELKMRWQEDALALKTDWVSISIGINDVWRKLGDSPNWVPLQEFEETYRDIAAQAHDNGSRLILMETGIIEQKMTSKGNLMLEDYNKVIGRIARELGAVLVEMRYEFAAMLNKWQDYQWTNDGVHTSCEGSVLMARAWLRAVGFEPEKWMV